MTQLSFGSGLLWGERTDVTIGSTGGNGAIAFGILQDISIDFDWTDKPLYGQFQFPVAIARGQGKITGKAKFAQILGRLYSDIFWGLGTTQQQFGVAWSEPQNIPANPGPYTVTVANAATYNDDLGVRYTSGVGIGSVSGNFQRVAAVSGPGQYSVNFTNGQYTFYSSDSSTAITISYTYTISGTGTLIKLTNQLIGTTPTFKATFDQNISPGSAGVKSIALRLNACMSSKMSFPTKIDDWTIQELDFSAFSDGSGTIGYLSTVE